MGELVFLHGDAEAVAAAAKLRTAGFVFKFTDDVDECSEDTRYMMVWRDDPLPAEADDEALMEFDADIKVAIGEIAESVAIVSSDHIPEKFGDFGGPELGLAPDLKLI
ncbi:MAG: hypothetical protein WB689_15475 [Xanthobacteraceae bacterium]